MQRCGTASSSAALLLLVLLRATSTTTAQTPELLWSDEFKVGGPVNPNNWNVRTGTGAQPGWGNGELQTYTDNSLNVAVRDDNLQITARNDTDTFTSGRIDTADKMELVYGTIIARIQNPDLDAGLWPAFWTLGANFFDPDVLWPASGEMNIMEMGQGDAIGEGVVNQRVVSAAHWKHEGNYAGYAGQKTFPESFLGSYHLFVLEWTPYNITTYVNNTEVWKMDIDSDVCTDCEEFHSPHFLILNMAVGGGFTSGNSSSSFGSSCGSSSHGGGCDNLRKAENITAFLPATMHVDWVRVYDNGYTNITILPKTPAPASAPVPAPTSSPVAAESGLPPCWVCNDGGTSSIGNPNVVVALPDNVTAVVGSESTSCGELARIAEVDRLFPDDVCVELDAQQLRDACGCPNTMAPVQAPSAGSVATSAPASPPLAAGGGGGSSKGKSGKGKGGKSGKGKSGKSGKNGPSGDSAFFTVSSSRQKGRRARRGVVGATITAYGLAHLL